jgi:hypothetical protein
MNIRKKLPNPDLSELNVWGQNHVPPSSYKIQIGYIELPKTVKFDEKWVDTPYRFSSFHDANDEASKRFIGYDYRITGSNDTPHWAVPSYLEQNRKILNPPSDPEKWYDENEVFPFAPSKYDTIDKNDQYVIDQLSKLKTPNIAKSVMNTPNIGKNMIKPKNINMQTIGNKDKLK